MQGVSEERTIEKIRRDVRLRLITTDNHSTVYHDSLVNQKNKSGRAGSIVMPIASCQSSVRIFKVAYAGLILERILKLCMEAR
jgi:hypothetical protein